VDEYEDENHQCELVCGKTLRCGNHACQMPCHKGPCLPCLEASFEELSCHCGRTKVYPPIACGMKIPVCPYSCSREPACGHITFSSHPCHADSEPCPPCPFLVTKSCMCGKTEVKNVPCHKTNVSCGQVCDQQLPCGGHRCKRTCHSGDCLTADADGLSRPRRAAGNARRPAVIPALLSATHPLAARRTSRVRLRL